MKSPKITNLIMGGTHYCRGGGGGRGVTTLHPRVATSFYGLKTLRQLLSHSCPYFQLQITWLYLFCVKEDVLCMQQTSLVLTWHMLVAVIRLRGLV